MCACSGRKVRRLSEKALSVTAELYASGLSLSQVGHELGMTAPAVLYRLRLAGVQTRQAGGNRVR